MPQEPVQPVHIVLPGVDPDRPMLAGVDVSAGPLYTIGEVSKSFFELTKYWIRWLDEKGLLEVEEPGVPGEPAFALTVAGEGTYRVGPKPRQVTFTPDPHFAGPLTPVPYRAAGEDQPYDEVALTAWPPLVPGAEPRSLAADPRWFDPASLRLIVPDGKPARALTVPNRGVLAVDLGSVRFTPDPRFPRNRTSDVTYLVTDSEGLSLMSTIRLSVDGSGAASVTQVGSAVLLLPGGAPEEIDLVVPPEGARVRVKAYERKPTPRGGKAGARSFSLAHIEAIVHALAGAQAIDGEDAARALAVVYAVARVKGYLPDQVGADRQDRVERAAIVAEMQSLLLSDDETPTDMRVLVGRLAELERERA